MNTVAFVTGESSTSVTRPTRSGRLRPAARLVLHASQTLAPTANIRISFIAISPFRCSLSLQGPLYRLSQPLTFEVAAYNPALLVDQENRRQRAHVKSRRH